MAIRWLLILAFLLCGRAYAASCPAPIVFTNGSPSQAADMNTNFSNLASCGNSIDNSNVGPLGLFASQIVPTSTATATFGGSVAYTFTHGLSIVGGLAGTSTFSTTTSLTAGSFSTPVTSLVASYGPHGTLLGSSAHPFKSVTLTGIAGASKVNCYAVGASTTYCAIFSLSGAAVFSNGGTASAAPSFVCGGGFVPNTSFTGSAVYVSPANATIVVGSPSTIYVQAPLASAPVQVICYGY